MISYKVNPDPEAASQIPHFRVCQYSQQEGPVYYIWHRCGMYESLERQTGNWGPVKHTAKLSAVEVNSHKSP